MVSTLSALSCLMKASAPGELAFVVLDDLVDHLRGRVVGLRVVGRHLAVLGAVGLHERRVLRRVERRAVLQRGDVADHLVAHRRQHELVIARSAAEHRLLVAGRRELLRELQRHRADHEREDRVGVRLDGRDVRPEVLGAERRPDLLDDLPAAGFEAALEAADHLVAERVVGADRDDLLVALLAGPLAERMAAAASSSSWCGSGRDTSAGRAGSGRRPRRPETTYTVLLLVLSGASA